VLLASLDDDLSTRDRALAYELTLGVLRWQLFLDRLISHYSNRDPARLDQAVLIVLRLGLYQLRFLTRIPPAAAVNDAVNLVRHARVSSADKFVNAVLRRAIREADFDPTSDIEDPITAVSVETSHPRWLIERWSRSFGLDETRRFAGANNEAAPVSFRITCKVSSNDEVLDKLISSGANLSPSEVVPDAWRITGGTSLLRELTEAGQVYLQDEASQLVARALEPESAERILDLCAAPGSKTTHIASFSKPDALIVAGDLHEHRLHVVSQNASVQGLSNVYCMAFNGLEILPFAESSFDRVLVDAPCSGTGTLRRNPEIRWRISARDIDELADRQRQLLNRAARVVKPGGTLLYSTCSVETEENEQVAEAFLNANGAFRRGTLPVQSSLITNSGAARTWPHHHGTDGFFITLFERKS
jgi:16S rRNA (cytosine967-C5)-methyltransferase